MTMRRILLVLAFAGTLLATGCRHCCKRSNGGPPTRGPSGPGGVPFSGAPNLPPQNLPAIDPPPGPSRSSPELLLPTPMPPGTSSYSPQPRNTVVLGEPDFEAPADRPGEVRKPAVKPPLPTIDEEASSPFPTGIAGYAQVKEGVTNGLRPDKLEGFDWLKKNRTRTIVYLRGAKEDDSSDRSQVEKRGMNYRTLTITPETLNAELVTRFNDLVNNSEARPLFVYDRDGALAGAMWYLHFRTADLLSDEEARLRAARFGLKDKGGPEQTALWTAVQKYLSEMNP